MSQILVVAYHPVVLKGICEAISEKHPESKIVATATDINSFLTLLKSHKPDMAVIDVAVTWKSEIDLLDEIYSIQPDIKLNFISVHPFDKSVQQYLSSKANKRRQKANKPIYTPLHQYSDQQYQKPISDHISTFKASSSNGK